VSGREDRRGSDARPDTATVERRFTRPVPRVGDATSAAQPAADPAGWRFPDAAREAVYAVVAARRDVRRFRPDPVPDDVLERVLNAAHAAPSVRHSQPWRFLVVDDSEIRDRAAVLADAERLAQATRLDEESGRRMRDLQPGRSSRDSASSRCSISGSRPGRVSGHRLLPSCC